MPLALDITLILVLVTLVLTLVPLLIQLHKTARGIDRFLATVQKDVSQIAEDVHASRLRMDHMAGSVEVSLAEFSAFSKTIGAVGHTVEALHAHFQRSFESASRGLGGFMGAISTVLALFKSKPSTLETP